MEKNSKNIISDFVKNWVQGAVRMNSAYFVSCVDQVKQISFVGGMGVERGGWGHIWEHTKTILSASWGGLGITDLGSDVHSRLHMSTAALLDAIDAQPPPHPPILACIVIDAYPLQGTNRPPHMHNYWCDLATTGNKSRCLSIDRGQHNLINDRISVRMIIFY